MNDILKTLKDAGYKPEVIEDDGGFEPVKGQYICRIDSAGRKVGKSEKTGDDYDFRTIKFQVADIVSGDRAINRFFDLTYNPDIEGTKRLLNDLHTAGIEIKATNDSELDAELETLRDRTANVRTWVRTKQIKDGDRWIDDPLGEKKQWIKVVKEFKSGKKKPSSIKSDVPF